MSISQEERGELARIQGEQLDRMVMINDVQCVCAVMRGVILSPEYSDADLISMIVKGDAVGIIGASKGWPL